MSFLKRHWKNLWQLAFLLTATSWLFAPIINPILTSPDALINHFEVPGMAYSWLFRACDVIAGLLLLGMAGYMMKKQRGLSISSGLLAVIGIAIAVDAFIPTGCHITSGLCREENAEAVIGHAIDNTVAVGAMLALAAWDTFRKKRVPSGFFLTFQILYGGLFLTQYASIYHFGTFSQFLYQSVTIVWLAWFAVTQFDNEPHPPRATSNVNKVLAVWVGINGIATILLAVVHIGYFGFLQSFYFAEDNTWLSQHGLIVGLVFLYISRHIARGERRAWQILVMLIGFEVLKYAIIIPQPALLALYIITFAFVFTARDYFNRGVVAQSWRSRIVDITIMLGGVMIAIVIIGELLLHTPAHPLVNSTLHRSGRIISSTSHFTKSHVKETIRARIVTLLVISSTAFLLWALFQPAQHEHGVASLNEVEEAEALLHQYSRSTEDFFKIWPHDKQYFWLGNRRAFIAYKVVGPVAFALADPVADTPKDQQNILDDFMSYCRTHGWRVCFMVISDKTRSLYSNDALNFLKVGASAVVDIDKYCNETARNKWWRWQNNKGTKLGYKYEVLQAPHSHELLNELKAVSDEWLKRDGHQEEGFALGYFDVSYLQRCRIHLLRDEQSRVVAFVNELPIYNNLPQTTIDLIRFIEDAPNANNFLIYNVLHHLNKEDRYKYFDIGFVPLAQMTGRLARIARTLGAGRFSAAGLEQFKNKFEPDWQENYFAYDGDVGDLALIALNLEKAMAVDLQKQKTLRR